MKGRTSMPKTVELEQLRISAESETLSVDAEAKTINGFVVAQGGPFRTAGRGAFDDRSLKAIVRLIKSDPQGLSSYYGHATAADPEQLGRFLGRASNPRIETIKVSRNGQKMEVPAVLADLQLSPASFNTPTGDLGGYILKLAATDPRAFAASLTLEAAKEHQLFRGRQQLDEQGNPLPPIWRPLSLASIDIVSRGEAVDSFLPAKLSAARAMECLNADPDVPQEDTEAADLAALIDLEVE
jgi:hypothetical protein